MNSTVIPEHKHYALHVHTGSGCKTSRTAPRRRWVVSFTLRPLYLWGVFSDTPCVGDWKDPKADSNTLESQIHLCPVVQPVN